MSRENPEQQPITSAEKEQQKELNRTAFETKEGEKFFAERLTSPEDPRVEKVQKILETHLGKEEVDPIEVMKQTMTGKMETGEEVPPYLVHVAENSKGEIKGVQMGAVVETVDVKGNISEKSGVLLDCYSVVSPEMRNKGIWKELFRNQEESAKKDAERRGLEIKGFMAEAHNDLEPILNQEGAKRAYIKTKDGSFSELPYEQPPLDWNPKTGKPGEDAGIVPEHLMLKLASGKNKLSGKELMEMVRGMYLYNNYREEEYFKNPKAYERHTEFVKGIEQKLVDFIGRKTVYLLSSQEREAAKAMGVKFIEHREEEDKLEVKKEARKLEGEKKLVETAKIPAEGIKPEAILKEAGIEKPAESFEEFQKRLAEKIGGARTSVGERLSEGEELMMARNAYLAELGYSVKYRGLLLDKIEILDENNKVLTDGKDKPIEFKSFYSSRTERQVNDFLKEKLKEKLDGKPAENLTEEEKLEKGFQKTVKTAEQEQGRRGEKISSLQDAQKVGRGRLEKLMGGLSYIAALDKLGILGLRGGKKLAVEGGKDLTAIGLSPAVAIEEAGREIAGRIQVREALRRGSLAERKIEMLEKIPAEKRPEYYGQLLEGIKETSQRGTEEMIRGYDKMYKKGKILRFLEAFGGRFGKAMGERLEPKAY